MWIKCEVKDDIMFMTAANGLVIKTAKVQVNNLTIKDNLSGDLFKPTIPEAIFYIDREAVETAIKIGKCSIFDDGSDFRPVRVSEDRIIIGDVEIKYKPYKLKYPDVTKFFKLNHLVELDHIGVNLKMLKIVSEFVNDGWCAKIDFVVAEETKQKGEKVGVYRIDYGDNEHMAYLMPVLIQT